MTITIEEFKEDIDKYLSKANDEDIIITKDGKRYLRLTKAIQLQTKLSSITNEHNQYHLQDSKNRKRRNIL